jgi:hypothetical protein
MRGMSWPQGSAKLSLFDVTSSPFIGRNKAKIDEQWILDPVIQERYGVFKNTLNHWIAGI